MPTTFRQLLDRCPAAYRDFNYHPARRTYHTLGPHGWCVCPAAMIALAGCKGCPPVPQHLVGRRRFPREVDRWWRQWLMPAQYSGFLAGIDGDPCEPPAACVDAEGAHLWTVGHAAGVSLAARLWTPNGELVGRKRA